MALVNIRRDATDEQLSLLGTFHLVVAGVAALFSLFPLLHIWVGMRLLKGESPVPGSSGGPPAGDVTEMVGWMFVILPSVIILLGLTFSACLAWAGRCLRARRRFNFCQVMAALSCAFLPMGTVLGVFTLVVLNREGVKDRFAPGDAAGGGASQQG